MQNNIADETNEHGKGLVAYDEEPAAEPKEASSARFV